MTNRLGLKWQLVDGMYEEKDIAVHKAKAKQLKKDFYDDVICNGLPVAGLFFMFKKSTWKRVKFREGDIIGDDGIYFDWNFCERVKALGMPIRIMQGVYLFHLYRMGKNIRDVTHIVRKKKQLV
jgi:hypothetical protein